MIVGLFHPIRLTCCDATCQWDRTINLNELPPWLIEAAAAARDDAVSAGAMCCPSLSREAEAIRLTLTNIQNALHLCLPVLTA